MNPYPNGATALLNKIDCGNRRCIIATNNEVEERDARVAAPDDSGESRETIQADVKDDKRDRKLSLQPRAKTQRPSKEK